jgi:hypothetical protein
VLWPKKPPEENEHTIRWSGLLSNYHEIAAEHHSPPPRTPAGETVLIVNILSKGRFAGTALTARGFVLSACWLGVEAHREEKGRRDMLSWVAAAGAAQPRQTAIQPAAAHPPAVSFF